MASINYSFVPNQNVYVIKNIDNNYESVTSGVVVRATIKILVTGYAIEYDIRLNNNVGTLPFEESDVFVDKDAALLEYTNRVA